MKKFDLEAAKNGAPVITRDGKHARIICFDLKNSEYKLAVAIEYEDGEDIETYTIDGVFQIDSKDEKLNLFMAPVKKKGWVNVYRPSSGAIAASLSNAYASKEIADVRTDGNRIACVEIEWPE